MNQVINTLLNNSRGQFVGVTFIKKDGVVRNLNGVIAQRGTGHPDYITVFDVQNNGYRSVNRRTILEVRAGGCIIVNTKT